MSTLVGYSGMIKITSLHRLLSATTDFGKSTKPVEHQISRVQARLSQGIDVEGNSFAPYKDQKRKHPHSRPLEHAAKLFEPTSFDLERNLTNSEFRASIHGQAARIAVYQNVRRKFLGYSRRDREEVMSDMKQTLREAWRVAR